MRHTDGRPVQAGEHDALALDLGSSSVRAVLGTLRDGVVTTEEIFRLGHEVTTQQDHLVWDFERIMQGVRRSLEIAEERLGHAPESVGVDTWGVDYGLLAPSGSLLRVPRAYRDARMSRVSAGLEQRLGREAAWEATGVQPQEINTSYQLFADLGEEPRLREQVGLVLLLPDLVAYLLGAAPAVGRAIASTTGLATPGASAWSGTVLDALEVPRTWLPGLVDDGTVAGRTPGGTAIVRPAGHDTACAVHALGLAPRDVRLFISSGSWSLIGATVPEPVMSAAARDNGLTNEVRTDGGIRLLRNLTGFWLLQECQRAWEEPDTGRLMEEASCAPSLGVVVNPDDPAFVRPGGMPARLATWCEEQYGVRPEGRGQTVRLIIESLACAHAAYAEQLERVVGDALDPDSPIHLMGGGARNDMLAAMTASACGRPVVVGPVEASALGNILAQLEATGAISSIERGDVVRASTDQRVVEPGSLAPFDSMRERLLAVTAG